MTDRNGGRRDHLAPLGYQRLRLLQALTPGYAKAPAYTRFDPPPGSDVFVAFREHIDRLSREWAGAKEPIAISLLATGRLLCGDLAAADTILDHLAAEPHKLCAYGHAYIPLLPQRIFASALPIPSELKDTLRWIEGAPEQAALRAWLDSTRGRLMWIEADGVYALRSAD